MPDLEIIRHLAAIVESAGDAIISKSLNGVILSWNTSAERLYGYTSEEVVGKHISVLVSPERAEEVDDILSKIRRGSAIDHFETLRLRKDGTTVAVSMTISPILDSFGCVVGASTIARDISRRQEEDEIRFRLAAIVDSSDDAIISKSLHGIILSWNAAAERLYGYPSDEIVGKHISVLVPPDRAGEVDAILSKIRRGLAIDHFETLRVRKDGIEVAVSMTVSPILDYTGSVVAASTIARDISERNRLQAELEAARDQALEVSRLKSDFLAMMSHEIRTPMNGVIGMTGLLLDGELDPEQREYAETIRSSGESLLTIINDILDFSKIEAGKLDLEFVDFDLRSVIEEVAGLLADEAQNKGLELLTLVHPEVNTRVSGDPVRFRQILTNLIGNGIKFTDSGEVVVRAELAHESEDDVLIRVEVADTGIGIAPAAMASLFEPFSQADSSTTRTHGGTGLGLAICKQLVDRMGGEIAVRSELDKGSAFTFTARLVKQPHRPADRPPGSRVDLRGLRVLIVDDNATNRKILAHQVTSWGMHNEVAAGGVDALEHMKSAEASRKSYEVVLLDMDMPGMDGLQVADAMNGDAALRKIPIVMLTSTAVRGSAEMARSAGVSAFLSKPVRYSQLFEAITNVVDAAQDAEPSLRTRHRLAPAETSFLPRLLVAEDNPVNQKVAAAMLAKLGYHYDIVANGSEAVAAISRGPYGAVLMDCQMPGMDGYDACAEVRRRERDGHHVPIIAMTAGAMVGDREKCLAAGMDDYLAKPVNLDQLRRVLHRWVKKADSCADRDDELPVVEEREIPKPLLPAEDPRARG